jgi:hypothetical protein
VVAHAETVSNGPPSNARSTVNHTPTASQGNNKSFKPTVNQSYHQKKKSVAPLGVTSSRSLTLKQLKDIINDIYS